jgi:hypothetical protein
VTRKTILTIELERTRVITGGQGKRVLFCGVCEATGEFISAPEAVEIAKFMGVKSPEVFHFYQAPDNKIYVCLNSIFDNS